MNHYIQYHNCETNGNTASEEAAESNLAIRTTKKAANVIGNRIWLIAGEGKPKRYYLCYTFIADQIECEDSMNVISGAKGKKFTPEPIEISKQPWFRNFLKEMANFSLGLRKLPDRYIENFTSLISHGSNETVTPINEIDSCEVVASEIENTFPNIQVGRLILSQLLNSSNYANQVSSESWAATLFKDGKGFRLNVGPVEALWFLNGELKINLLASELKTPKFSGHFYPNDYRSIRGDVLTYAISGDEFTRFTDELLYAHYKFIDAAARNDGGRARKTPYHRSHSNLLIEYAKWLLEDEQIEDADDAEPEKNTPFLREGSKQSKLVSVYERNSRARSQCISHYGPVCTICGFDFEKIYGSIGKGYIHVHHVVPIASISESYIIDPINDLRPLCANCHAMVHSKWPPYEINEIATQIKKVAHNKLLQP